MAVRSVIEYTRWVEAMKVVRSGVTSPRCSARPASISSEAITTSSSPGTGASASTGCAPVGHRVAREHLQVVDGGAGALGHAGHRGGLRDEAVVLGQVHQPVGQHAAALAAHGEQRDGDGARVAHAASPSSRRSMRACSQPITARAHPLLEAVPAGRVVDDLGAVERGAQHRRMRHLAAQAAADAAVQHGGHRVARAADPGSA